MAAWHRTWRTDLGLRVVGLILCGLAYLAIARLAALPLASRGGQAPGQDVLGRDVAAYGWATVGFLGASAGCLLTLCGAHIFDKIRVSARWRVRRIPHDEAGRPFP